MPPYTLYCCIPGCNSNTKMPNMKMYYFPQRRVLSDLWIKIINERYPTLEFTLDIHGRSSKNICRKHFESKYITCSGRRILYTIPTLFTETEIITGQPTHPIEIDLTEINHSNSENIRKERSPLSLVFQDHTYCGKTKNSLEELGEQYYSNAGYRNINISKQATKALNRYNNTLIQATKALNRDNNTQEKNIKAVNHYNKTLKQATEAENCDNNTSEHATEADNCDNNTSEHTTEAENCYNNTSEHATEAENCYNNTSEHATEADNCDNNSSEQNSEADNCDNNTSEHATEAHTEDNGEFEFHPWQPRFGGPEEKGVTANVVQKETNSTFSWQKPVEVIHDDDPDALDPPDPVPSITLEVDSCSGDQDQEMFPNEIDWAGAGVCGVERETRGVREGGDKHHGYQCNVCSTQITGVRYVCVQCLDFDLCGACEAAQQHCTHYVLRVPALSHISEVQAVLRTIRRALLMDAIVNIPAGAQPDFEEVKEEELEDPIGQEQPDIEYCDIDNDYQISTVATEFNQSVPEIDPINSEMVTDATEPTSLPNEYEMDPNVSDLNTSLKDDHNMDLNDSDLNTSLKYDLNMDLNDSDLNTSLKDDYNRDLNVSEELNTNLPGYSDMDSNVSELKTSINYEMDINCFEHYTKTGYYETALNPEYDASNPNINSLSITLENMDSNSYKLVVNDDRYNPNVIPDLKTITKFMPALTAKPCDIILSQSHSNIVQLKQTIDQPKVVVNDDRYDPNLIPDSKTITKFMPALTAKPCNIILSPSHSNTVQLRQTIDQPKVIVNDDRYDPNVIPVSKAITKFMPALTTKPCNIILSSPHSNSVQLKQTIDQPKVVVNDDRYDPNLIPDSKTVTKFMPALTAKPCNIILSSSHSNSAQLKQTIDQPKVIPELIAKLRNMLTPLSKSNSAQFDQTIDKEHALPKEHATTNISAESTEQPQMININDKKSPSPDPSSESDLIALIPGERRSIKHGDEVHTVTHLKPTKLTPVDLRALQTMTQLSFSTSDKRQTITKYVRSSETETVTKIMTAEKQEIPKSTPQTDTKLMTAERQEITKSTPAESQNITKLNPPELIKKPKVTILRSEVLRPAISKEKQTLAELTSALLDSLAPDFTGQKSSETPIQQEEITRQNSVESLTPEAPIEQLKITRQDSEERLRPATPNEQRKITRQNSAESLTPVTPIEQRKITRQKSVESLSPVTPIKKRKITRRQSAESSAPETPNQQLKLTRQKIFKSSTLAMLSKQLKIARQNSAESLTPVTPIDQRKITRQKSVESLTPAKKRKITRRKSVESSAPEKPNQQLKITRQKISKSSTRQNSGESSTPELPTEPQRITRQKSALLEKLTPDSPAERQRATRATTSSKSEKNHPSTKKNKNKKEAQMVKERLSQDGKRATQELKHKQKRRRASYETQTKHL